MLEFDARRFDPRLLDELLAETPHTVPSATATRSSSATPTSNAACARSTSTSARSAATPRSAPCSTTARRMRDLAATNIFPGDLLLKNFGVTSPRAA